MDNRCRWTLLERRDFMHPPLSADELVWIDWQLAQMPAMDVDANRIGLTGCLRPQLPNGATDDDLLDDIIDFPVRQLVTIPPSSMTNNLSMGQRKTLQWLHARLDGLLRPNCLLQESMARLAKMTIPPTGEALDFSLIHSIVPLYVVSILEMLAWSPLPLTRGFERCALTGLQILRRMSKDIDNHCKDTEKGHRWSDGLLVRLTPCLATLFVKSSSINLAISSLCLHTLDCMEMDDLGPDAGNRELAKSCINIREAVRKRAVQEAHIPAVQREGGLPLLPTPPSPRIISEPPEMEETLLRSRRKGFPAHYCLSSSSSPSLSSPSALLTQQAAWPWLPVPLHAEPSADGQLVLWQDCQGRAYLVKVQDVLDPLLLNESVSYYAMRPFEMLRVNLVKKNADLKWCPWTPAFTDGHTVYTVDPMTVACKRVGDLAITTRPLLSDPQPDIPTGRVVDYTYVWYHGVWVPCLVATIEDSDNNDQDNRNDQRTRDDVTIHHHQTTGLRAHFLGSKMPGSWTCWLPCQLTAWHSAPLLGERRSQRNKRKDGNSSCLIVTGNDGYVRAVSLLTGLIGWSVYLPQVHLVKAIHAATVMAKEQTSIMLVLCAARHCLFALYIRQSSISATRDATLDQEELAEDVVIVRLVLQLKGTCEEKGKEEAMEDMVTAVSDPVPLDHDHDRQLCWLGTLRGRLFQLTVADRDVVEVRELPGLQVGEAITHILPVHFPRAALLVSTVSRLLVLESSMAT
jgi:hypothetical protein